MPDCSLNKALRSLCVRRFRLYLPSHPPSLWVGIGRSAPAFRPGRLPPAARDDGKSRRFQNSHDARTEQALR